jgi:hypothetical protein
VVVVVVVVDSTVAVAVAVVSLHNVAEYRPFLLLAFAPQVSPECTEPERTFPI